MLLSAPVLGLGALAVFSLLKVLIKRLTTGRWRSCLAWALLGVLASAALGIALAGSFDMSWILLLPPTLVSAGLCLLFGRTLLPGREPLITRFRRFCDGHLTPEICLYTRRWTVFWTVFLGFATIVSLFAALYVELAVWSWMMNIGYPIAVAAIFLGEHLYRERYLAHFGPASVTRTLRAMARPDAWTLETVEPGNPR